MTIVSLAQLKESVRCLNTQQRTELRTYINALNAYDPMTAECFPEQLRALNSACLSVVGDHWPVLRSLPKVIQRGMEEKLAQADTLTGQLKLTLIGTQRLWEIYLIGLRDSGAPVTPKTLGQWSVSPRAHLTAQLPLPSYLQTQLLNGGVENG